MLSPRYWCRRGYSIRATHRCAAPTPPGERRRGRWQAAPAGRAVAARTTACTGLRNDASEERTGASERVGSRHVRTGADVRQGAARSCERGRLAAQSAWTQSASTLAVLTFQSDSKGGTADVFRRGLELRHLSFQREAAIHQRGEDLLGAGVHAAFAFQQATDASTRADGPSGRGDGGRPRASARALTLATIRMRFDVRADEAGYGGANASLPPKHAVDAHTRHATHKSARARPRTSGPRTPAAR